MRTMKTSDLTSVALAWGVAKSEGLEVDLSRGGLVVFDADAHPKLRNEYNDHRWQVYHPEFDWAQGGKIIEREKIGVVPNPENASVWIGSVNEPDGGWRFNRTGETPLIAAMRCYVASKLGDEVEIPEEIGRAHV